MIGCFRNAASKTVFLQLPPNPHRGRTGQPRIHSQGSYPTFLVQALPRLKDRNEPCEIVADSKPHRGNSCSISSEQAPCGGAMTRETATLPFCSSRFARATAWVSRNVRCS